MDQGAATATIGNRHAGGATFAETATAAALRAGFDLSGVIALPFPRVEAFEQWIASGYQGDMEYLARTDDSGRLRRTGVEVALPWAKSIVVCGLNYNPDAPYSTDARARDRGWISRYAIGGSIDAQGEHRCADYHDVLMCRLRAVEAELTANFHIKRSRCYVDTGPMIERALAQAAGIGWIGKNTCLINERERLGSWIFLGVVITDFDVGSVSAAEVMGMAAADRCGTCTRCIDACPTGALIANDDGARQMDARKCIAYLTIEKRGAIPEEMRSAIGTHVFGCDICQDVCPWNSRKQRRAPTTSVAEFAAIEKLVSPDLEWLASLSVDEWRRMFRGSPVKRTKYAGFLRNVCVAMGNSGEQRFLPKLRELVSSEDAVIADHARWAVEQIKRRCTEPPIGADPATSE